MRRLVSLMAVAAILGTIPLASHAKIRDGKDCHQSGDTNAFVDNGVVDEPGNVDNADRGSYCVRAGGQTLFYIGGESRPEDPDNQGFSGLCGSLVIAGTTYGSGHPNANPNDPDDWDYDHTHPGDDGKLGTADDVIHHHDCN